MFSSPDFDPFPCSMVISLRWHFLLLRLHVFLLLTLLLRPISLDDMRYICVCKCVLGVYMCLGVGVGGSAGCGGLCVY